VKKHTIRMAMYRPDIA